MYFITAGWVFMTLRGIPDFVNKFVALHLNKKRIIFQTATLPFGGELRGRVGGWDRLVDFQPFLDEIEREGDLVIF